MADFTLADQAGVPRSLSELLRQGPVVLFFYPAALTKGCTAESCHFRDLLGEFGEVGAQAVGISADPVERQHQFDQRYDLGMPLLSDPSREVAQRFGVRRRFGPIPVKRSTFVIGQDGLLLAVVHSETRMALHADRALEILRKRQGESGSG